MRALDQAFQKSHARAKSEPEKTAVVERGSNTCETKSKVSPEKLSATFNSNCFAKTYWHRKLGHICRVTQRNRNPKLLNLSQSRTPASCLVVCPTFVPALPSGKQEPDAMAPPWMKTAWAEGLFRQRCRKGDKLWNFCVVYDSWVGTVDGSQGILPVLPALACNAQNGCARRQSTRGAIHEAAELSSPSKMECLSRRSTRNPQSLQP